MQMRPWLAFCLLVGCAPQESFVALAEPKPEPPPPVEAPAVVTLPPPPPPVAAATSVVAIVRPDPPPTSPSLLDPMDPCLPRGAASRAVASAALDRNQLLGEVRWAKQRAELCCPSATGSTQVVVTIASTGSPSAVAVAPPKGAAPALATCVKRLFSEIQVTPWIGAAVTEKSDLSTAMSAALTP